jgi:predicted metal-dependent phosphotriesterase family hydrolase
MTDLRNANRISAGIIETVLGPLDTCALGACQCHEHLFVARGRPAEVDPALLMEDVGCAVRELALYREAGGQAVVDAQPVGCGRMAGALREASGRSGVRIVASTGFHKLVYYPEDHWIFTRSRDSLAELFIRELTDGMRDDGCEPLPGCRAGILKTALDSCGVSGRYEALFEAAAASARITGAPVMLHVEKGADALDALSFFAKRSIPAEQLIFCHMDRAEERFDRHIEIARAGSFLEYDTIARFKYHSDERECELIEGMLAAGLENRLLLSLDTTRKRLKSYGGSPGLDYIRKVFIPKLTSRGVPAKIIRQLTVDNPAEALARRV